MSVTKKGYTLIETLVILLIVTSLTLISLTNYNELSLEQFYLMNDYCYNQSLAIKNTERISLNNEISFNELGHVNRAKTININGHKIVIHLGNGYFVYE